MDTSKIIKGMVNSGRYTVTVPIVKEDYGLYLQIEGVELPSTYEVDFSNSEHSGTSVTMIGNSDGVLIPHQFIDTGKDIFAFLYHVGEDFGRTVYKFRIPNKVRPDRTEETPTPEEQSVIDQAISALNTAVEQTAQDVIDADASAQAARYDADRAEEARGASLDYAEQAEASATSASQSATASANSASASAQSASQSAQIKSDVEDMVDDAQGYAQASAQSASASATSATQAQGYANSASASAQSASGYATQAQTSAQTASAKAQDASGYAQTATQKATESAQSASQALSYKTDAESAKTASQTAQGLAESARDLAQGYAEDAQGYAEDAQASAESISASASQIAQNTADILKAFPTDTAWGAVASFTDGADDIPLKSLVVDINPVQDLSNGDPSPENICPISGWEGMTVNASGKNLFGGDAWFGRGGTDDRENRTTTGGTTSSSLPFLGTLNGYPFKANTAYTLIVTMTSTATNGRPCYTFKYTDGTQTILQNNNIGTTKGTYAFVSNSAKTLYAIERASYSGTKVYYVDECGIFEGALTVDDFVSYTGRTIPISWQSEAGTVYGGNLNVLTGVLKITKHGFDGGDVVWNKNTDYNYGKFFTITSPFAKYFTSEPTVISSSYASASNKTAKTTGKYVWIRSMSVGLKQLRVKDDNYDDATTEEFRAAMTGVQFVYELAEPIEIQLTPQQVNSLLGANNIWADTVDTEVEYRADTKLYIEKLTQPEEDDMVADSAITSGQFFMVGNTLYRALANIASGATITVGTNAQRVSLSDALNLVNV